MKNENLIINILVFILWITIAFITGINHEPWADEAQAWLISRDNLFFDIIKTLKYEGHPFLWHFILRILNLIHFPYDLLFLIPILLSGFGVFLLLFKTKLPIIIKALFPFTFFILYQNTVIARSYALLLPILMLIVTIYSERLKKPATYIILLFLLLCSDSYSCVLSIILFAFYVYDVLLSKQISGKMICLILGYVFFFIFTVLYLQIPADYSLALPTFNFSFKNLILTFSNGYFDLFGESINWSNVILPLTLYLLAIILFCKNIRQILLFILCNLSVITAISMLISRYWHFGYIIITLIFSISLLLEENKISLKKDLKSAAFAIIFAFLALIQIKWSFTAINYDIKNNYDSSKEAAQFIKNNKLEKYRIHGLGYNMVALQPYFKQNIFDNYESSYYKFSSSFEKKLYIEGRSYAPIIILDPSFYSYFEDYIKTLKDYDIYTFNGSVRTKSSIKPTVDLFVFVEKNIKLQGSCNKI